MLATSRPSPLLHPSTWSEQALSLMTFNIEYGGYRSNTNVGQYCEIMRLFDIKLACYQEPYRLDKSGDFERYDARESYGENVGRLIADELGFYETTLFNEYPCSLVSLRKIDVLSENLVYIKDWDLYVTPVHLTDRAFGLYFDDPSICDPYYLSDRLAYLNIDKFSASYSTREPLMNSILLHHSRLENEKWVILGDFNEPSCLDFVNSPWKISSNLLGPEYGFKDSYFVINKNSREPCFTYHNEGEPSSRIDFIYTSSAIQVKGSTILKLYDSLSDHLPVVSNILL